MKHDPEHIQNLAHETAESLTKGAWPAFLRTAAWNFKYDFTSQLLIFAQKPDATACAPHELWTSPPFHRRPLKGRAIALLTNHSADSELRYVFDISDTVVKKDAPNPVDPVWEVTPEKEPAVRKSLAEAFLPYEQQTELHLASNASDFYRSIATSIVRTHFEEFFKELTDVKTERTLRDFLTESVSAMLQFRCGLLPEINERALSNAEHLNAIVPISSLGAAVQKMAKTGLLAVSHAVHTWDAQHKGQSRSHTERREDEAAKTDLGICENDIIRAITVGPPLENGKYRLQKAAEDPKHTSEQLADILRTEYGTGQRPFLLSSGIAGTLFWGPQGLRIERNGLQECVHLALDWKTASERLKSLVRADLYLDTSEKNHMRVWSEAQIALKKRQEIGASASAFLTTLIPSHPDFQLYLEHIRAYVYEYSESTQQQLVEDLSKAGASEYIQRNPSARSFLNTLVESIFDLSESAQKAHSASEPRIPPEEERAIDGVDSEVPSIANASQGTDQATPSQGDYSEAFLLYSENKRFNSCNDCAPTPRKENTFSCANAAKGGNNAASSSFFSSEQGSSEPSVGQESVPSHHSERPKEPLIDHPELRQKELHRLARSDKVVLTDLLYHYITYRCTFKSHTPELCERDAASREEQMAVLEDILVSPSVAENLNNLRLAKSILTRWFLPFEGIRPEILAEQEKLMEAADNVLLNPPEQDEEPAHEYTHDYNYTHIKTPDSATLEEDKDETLWDYEHSSERGEASLLAVKIKNAQSRSSFSCAEKSCGLLEIGN